MNILKAFKADVKQAFTKTKSPQVLIAEIHNEFDTSTERLLNEAKAIIGQSDKVQIDKAERLKKLGFSLSKDVAETAEQIENEKESKNLAESIMYFQQWYPSNKFITEKEVMRICHKYSLVCGGVAYYKGNVPEKNLSEIESFNLRDEDGEPEYRYTDYQNRNEMGALGVFSDRNAHRMWERQMMMAMAQPPRYTATPTGKNLKPPFKICAPIKDFDTTRMRVAEGYKLQHIPDPIVLQPVKGGYLVISKWGLEASDEGLVNEKMN